MGRNFNWNERLLQESEHSNFRNLQVSQNQTKKNFFFFYEIKEAANRDKEKI